MKIEMGTRAFLSPGNAVSGGAARHQPLDAWTPGGPASGDSLSKAELSMLKHGLSPRPNLPTADDLKGCLYSHGLSEHWAEVKAAYDFAQGAHKAQTRDDGSPYHFHCARTLRNAVEQFGVTDPAALKAAVLHDVLEDTGVTAEELRKRFGDKTVRYVQLLSKPPLNPGETYEQRNTRYLERLEGSGLKDAVALKLSDRTDNIDDAHLMPDLDKVRRYLDDTRGHYIPLAQRHFPERAAELQAKVSRIESWLGPAPSNGA